MALYRFCSMNHFESVDEIRNGQLDMQPEYYNAYVCDSLQRAL